MLVIVTAETCPVVDAQTVALASTQMLHGFVLVTLVAGGSSSALGRCECPAPPVIAAEQQTLAGDTVIAFCNHPGWRPGKLQTRGEGRWIVPLAGAG